MDKHESKRKAIKGKLMLIKNHCKICFEIKKIKAGSVTHWDIEN